MNAIKKLTSSRRFLLTNILTVAALVLITVLASIIYIADQNGKKQLEQNTTAWAKALAKASSPYLQQNKNGAKEKLNEQLSQLITSTDINYIHIYKQRDNGDISYFSNFNKNTYFLSLPDKIDHIEQLSQLKHHQNYVELIVKIKQNQVLYGYLYIQYSNEKLSSYISKLLFIAVTFFVTALFLFTMLSLFINKKINEPVTFLKSSIQSISQNKDFSQRISNVSFSEIDSLVKSINFLLNRVESHISKQNKLYQQTLQKNNELTGKVGARTDALKESNQELLTTLEKLHQFQAQLVETEKMASLGNMVAGIAHEINTPIGLCITASTLLDDRLKEIQHAFETKTLKSSQLKKFLSESEENIDIIYRNLARGTQLISSFKKVSVDQTNTEMRSFNVSDLLDEVVLTLKEKINQENVKLIIDCPPNLIIESKKEPINQILLNLIINSIIHGFEYNDQGVIHISINYLSEQLHVVYQDDGIGIDKNIQSNAFDPFITTKRGDGSSGLGLHLVFNLVTQALNGHIDFVSDIEHGTLFNITFPVTLLSDNSIIATS